jgi:CelD/BcsL family acetyltransferase involved in cellulose biosynthesis
MIGKNPQALALAFKKCRGKLLKIAELGIKSDQTDKITEAMIETLAEQKAIDMKVDLAEVVVGQRWYVEGLIRFSGLTVEAQLQAEYDDSFADTASEGEMLQALTALTA